MYPQGNSQTTAEFFSLFLIVADADKLETGWERVLTKYSLTVINQVHPEKHVTLPVTGGMSYISSFFAHGLACPVCFWFLF